MGVFIDPETSAGWTLIKQFGGCSMGLLPDTQNVDCACAGNAGNVFPHRRLQSKPLISDPGMHHGTCVTHVPWCMSGSLTRGGGESVPGIPGACAPAILRILQEAHGAPISGPTAQRGTRDFVTTLVCNGPHPDMDKEFANRPRQWPPASLISVLLKLPMLLVLVGHKLSPEFHLQARISWSRFELKLIQELPKSVHQGYIACKYVLKRLLKARRGQNNAGEGRNCVSSYHIKTTLLRYLEKTPPSMITSPFGLFLDLLNELDEYFKMRKLPHYFLAQCDLLETVADDELCIARQVIGEILSDPLNALLTSPTHPEQIYGEVSPDYIASAFLGVCSHPTSAQCREDLSEVLAPVDKRRRQRYREQREMDERRVSGRAELTGLVDTLRRMKSI